MNKSVKITIKKELRTTIRDKKSLMMMLVIPLFIPLFVILFSAFYDTMMEPTIYTVGVDYELTEVEKEIIDTLSIEVKTFKTNELDKAYDNEKIAAYVKLDEETYTIYSNINTAGGSVAVAEINNYLTAYSNYLGQIYLEENNINPEKVFNIINSELEELPGNNDMFNQILFMAFVFAIISITTTAIQAATDSTAGEKERGTLETLLTFPIKSKDLIMGKYMACLIVCIITALFSGILLYVSLFIAKGMFVFYNEIAFSFTIPTILLAFLILVGFSLFISGLAIGIASLTKTNKEAQSSLMPLSFLPMLPMFLNMFGMEMDAVLSLIPIVNHTLLLNEIFIGNINVLHISLMLISTVICIFIVIRYLISQYKSEKILFSI